MAQDSISTAMAATNPAKRVKLTGRAFYESIGSPKMIVAPMVDRSEFAWRLLTRSYLDEERSKELLAYTPMLHARLFKEQARFRDAHFQPTKESLVSKEPSTAPAYLDGNEKIDRPLFVQFCANKPDELLDAAQYVTPYCDAVDLNLGCPQGIAKSGHYGAFLQEDWDTIHKLIRKLSDELSVPVTAKMRILETPDKTLAYAKTILDAGASILTVHGRQRHQKGHNTGVADWKMIRFLRENLPKETVLFANGNILNYQDIEPCLEATGADGIMSAEGNLSDPTIFAKPPEGESREYWRDPLNPEIGGYRIDAVFRRYQDIIYRYVLEQEPPRRAPLYLPSKVLPENTDGTPSETVPEIPVSSSKRPADTEPETTNHADASTASLSGRPSKKQKKAQHKKKDMTAVHNPNLKSMQGHLFQLLRPMINSHTNIRDALARSRAGDIAAFEHVLSLVEAAVKQGLDEEWQTRKSGADNSTVKQQNGEEAIAKITGSQAVRERCKRPFWVCQPHVRPLPEEAIQIGAMTLSKKEKKDQEAKTAEKSEERKRDGHLSSNLAASRSQAAVADGLQNGTPTNTQEIGKELPREEALACG